LHSDPFEAGKTYLVKHAVRQTKIKAARIVNRINVNTFARENAARLRMNDIAEVELESSLPLFFDAYSTNRITGSFILIDALTNATVGAGMITEASGEDGVANRPAWDATDSGELTARVTAGQRQERNGHAAAVIVTGVRSHLGPQIERLLFARGFQAVLVESSDIPPSELLRFARLFIAAGFILIYSGDVPGEADREQLSADSGKRFYLLDGGNAPKTEEEAMRDVLAIAESLRAVPDAEDRKRVNG
jgi:bifunctional enzyme CysN/CysC/sulfate adenylyltransferase subunit 1